MGSSRGRNQGYLDVYRRRGGRGGIQTGLTRWTRESRHVGAARPGRLAEPSPSGSSRVAENFPGASPLASPSGYLVWSTSGYCWFSMFRPMMSVPAWRLWGYRYEARIMRQPSFFIELCSWVPGSWFCSWAGVAGMLSQGLFVPKGNGTLFHLRHYSRKEGMDAIL